MSRSRNVPGDIVSSFFLICVHSIPPKENIKAADIGTHPRKGSECAWWWEFSCIEYTR